ncbi:acetoacetate--CoA ligase [Truepera radiovictrix]|uniref:Acetoacetyl-CoA synthase n=1 Tax=Truepera radiovictrix (strain DSM 17093 / CIP 108686 / LMG 22925 / RQ-24) TaxID=649638 RepID=D7CSY3_TRURR|nr:acetoacetate--CoA ligase [Truepera radiovictrix]ADI13750.1 acetoacetyl-CoA synthase [Truepera radiovictrix DSM 17093]WMT57685.1 acetoacetate--CoA ligase [Truepera radiovictrix]
MEPLWTPSPERVERAELTRFRRAAEAHLGRALPDYRALHAWTVADPAAFWAFYAADAALPLTPPTGAVMSSDPMPYTRWFEGATLNYAEALLFPPALTDPAQPALIATDETGGERTLSYAELRRAVARCAAALRRSGVGPGDRVAGVLCNMPEAVVLLLGCAAVGAIFSSCSPDFGLGAAGDRFGQIEPKLLVGVSGYRYGGKAFSTVEMLTGLRARLSPEVAVVIGEGALEGWVPWESWLGEAAAPQFTPLPFDHPLYILYSSGTTGLPKAMVHRAGGALLAHHREHRLHSDIRAGDRVMYFTTCGWMMWNWLISALAQGATLVLYDGSPTYPDLGALWRLASRLEVTHFGTSARFIHACKAAGERPGDASAFPALRCVLSTGSPLSPAGFVWVYEALKRDVHLASISGGTDIVSCFMGGDPTAPVYAGQIQAPGLGVDLAIFDERGEETVGPGELVCRKPLPSMPLAFWGDPDFSRYKAAYFSVYPGVWRHGDLIAWAPEGGIVVYGRSDATLNPGGVRIGTAEIYRPLETVPEVADALAVGKREDGDEVIWLFVVLQADAVLDEALKERIKGAIRRLSSPRHVPKRIFAVSQLPRTRSGKTVEIAVSRLLNGLEVPNRQVMENPEALEEILGVVGGAQ